MQQQEDKEDNSDEEEQEPQVKKQPPKQEGMERGAARKRSAMSGSKLDAEAESAPKKTKRSPKERTVVTQPPTPNGARTAPLKRKKVQRAIAVVQG